MAQVEKKLHHLTIHEAGKLLKGGELSPVELTQALLDRIAETDDRLHSFITLLSDEAMGEARTAEWPQRDPWDSRVVLIGRVVPKLY